MKQTIFKLFLLTFITFTLSNCEKEIEQTPEIENNSSNFIIKRVEYIEIKDKLDEIDKQLNFNPYLDVNKPDLTFARTTIDTLGFTLYTDKIVEMSSGDYTSYTMQIKTVDITNNKIKNLTVDEMNGESNMFVTTYVPTDQWLENQNEPFEGTIVVQSMGSPDELEENDPEEGNSGGGTFFDPFIDDCDGTVIETTIAIPYGCSCYGHMPGHPTCVCKDYGYNYETVYECIPDNSIDDGLNNNNGSTGVGSTGVGISNPVPKATSLVNPNGTSVLINIIGLDSLTVEQLSWINDTANATEVNLLLNFISENNMSSEALDFAYLIINLHAEASITPKIENIEEELKCFNIAEPARLTIYAEQAIENSREVTARLVHTFVGIEQNGIIRNLGFYPDNGGAANLIASQNGEIHDNSNSPYHVSITIDITASQLDDVITYIENYPSTYDLNNYNCSDFGIAVALEGGLVLPATNGSYGIFFEGRNPSDLGEDMRELNLPVGANRDLDGGNAPSRLGTCF